MSDLDEKELKATREIKQINKIISPEEEDYIPAEHPYKEFFATIVAILFMIVMYLFIFIFLFGLFYLGLNGE